MSAIALQKRQINTSTSAELPADERRGVGISIAGVRKNFGAGEILRGIDLEIAPGEFVAIVGRSGCGKSTLLRLMAGLDFANSGSIRLYDAEGEASKVRFLFQEARLLPWKRVIDNVGLGLTGNWRSVALGALLEVGLADRAGEWPSILSGGERQRVALARALVSHPKLLLLDEPLGALDALTRIEMQDLVEKVWENQEFTAVLVTHDVSEAVQLADRVIMIDHGQIALDVRIDLPRPRRHSMPEFGRLEARILARILGEQ